MKLRRKIGSTLAACGIVMLLFGISALPALGAAPERPQLQPSPRPAIDPIKSKGGGGVQMGHVTGTVIDLRTGAPAAGIAVLVGEAQAVTDANGNYDHWIEVGSYPVALSLSSAQGQASQGLIQVEVLAQTATVQHLSFMSPAPATAAVAPAPAAPAPPAPAANHTQAGMAPAGISTQGLPKRLPRTATSGGQSPALIWMAFGMLLLVMGGTVGFAPMISGRSAAALLRAQAHNSALLQSLLALPPVDDFLAALLDAHDRAGK